MPHSIALVGIGKIARDQHIPAIAGNADFTLSATASRNAEVGGITAYRSLADLLQAAPDITCVSLATPPQVRYGDARRALEAGRHVMLEKPPGATLSEVQALERLAAEKGVTLFATWHSRHAASVAATRDWLADRKIQRLHIDWREDVRHWHPGQDWIWEAGGLGVFDPGINALSVLTAILPEPVHLQKATLSFPANRDTPVAVDLTFEPLGGAPITAAFDWLEQGPPKWNIHIDTDAGNAILSEGGARLTIDGHETSAGEDQEYPALYARFAELIAAGTREVDLSPMTHVADAFTLGRRVITAPFEW
ncbi:Gfo/Idh/MocA family protein [Roseobacter sp. OBYS 0001]|uniref:Gfo/Idh/MocA family protein n=1 Tax=Roseobacter sp. OBYS 0001 TaxID=882651 RepID=UPI001BC1D1EA|nr:Gfo/Idh/MocA family oxidoreductase [Roseobacter sp. OBYS 0001]GIT87344.1 dehydrogenase [Roseobacter sp. OBYS 0001]